MKLKLKIKNKEYEAEILETPDGQVKIKIGDKEFVFLLSEEGKMVSPPSVIFPKRDFSRKEILAPISGIVSEIFVREGEWVKSGQKVMSLSAMKMENEIVSEFEGKVEKIFFQRGEQVKGGEVLMTLK